MCQAIHENTKIDKIDLKYKWLLLEQAFSVLCWQSGQYPPEKRPNTIKELATSSNISPLEACEKIEMIIARSKDIFVSDLDIQQLCEQTEKGPHIVRLEHTTNDECYILIDEFWKNPTWTPDNRLLIVKSEDRERALSASLALRNLGWNRTYCKIDF